MSVQPKLIRFNQNVLAKYQIYNSIFMTLPFDAITKTGVLLPLFHETCKKGFEKGEDPTLIVETFFKKYQARRNKESQIELLFRFIQYVERQVVLFDAIEDAAFPIVNNMEGIGTLRSLKESASSENKLDQLREYFEEFKVRIVLTAHPTQFYPGNVLGIITDLTKAIRENDLLLINDLLGQLGKTPFFQHTKPTPYDEAVSLIWYLNGRHRPRGRQRRREVHPHQGSRRCPALRRGRRPLRGRARVPRHPARCRSARHRGRLPGPRAVRQPRHRPEHVPRARRALRRHVRRGPHGEGGLRHPAVALGAHRQVGASEGVVALGRTAPDRRHRARRAEEGARRDPRRAHRRARRGADRAGAAPRGASQGAERRRRAHQPQPRGRLRGRGRHRRAVPRAAGRPAGDQGHEPRRRRRLHHRHEDPGRRAHRHHQHPHRRR